MQPKCDFITFYTELLSLCLVKSCTVLFIHLTGLHVRIDLWVPVSSFMWQCPVSCSPGTLIAWQAEGPLACGFYTDFQHSMANASSFFLFLANAIRAEVNDQSVSRSEQSLDKGYVNSKLGELINKNGIITNHSQVPEVRQGELMLQEMCLKAGGNASFDTASVRQILYAIS